MDLDVAGSNPVTRPNLPPLPAPLPSGKCRPVPHWSCCSSLTLIGTHGVALGAKQVKPALIRFFIAPLGARLMVYFFIQGACR